MKQRVSVTSFKGLFPLSAAGPGCVFGSIVRDDFEQFLDELVAVKKGLFCSIRAHQTNSVLDGKLRLSERK